MAKRAAIRRLALGLADQPHLCRIETFGNRDLGFFLAGHHRLERQMLIEDLATSAVDVARGDADLRVVETIERLAQKIDEPALALEQREKCQRALAMRHADL